MINFTFCRDEIIFSNHLLSYCTLRFNSTNKFGCQSSALPTYGHMVLIKQIAQLELELAKENVDKIVLILPTYIFIRKNLMTLILQTSRVVGVIVLTLDIKNLDSKITFFSELPNCKDGYFKSCHSTERTLYSDGYYFYLWKIPVILLMVVDSFKLFFERCTNRQGFTTNSDYTCDIEIKNYYSDDITYEYCESHKNSWTKYLWLVYNYDYCNNFNGYNIYITFNNVQYYNKKSIILLYTHTDSLSMFDNGAFGKAELYPTLGVMIYIANLFKKAADRNSIHEHSDILMAFVDNFDIEQMGTIKLIYDLKTNRVSNTKQNISLENIKLVIYLGEVLNWNQILVVEEKYCDKTEICNIFNSYLHELSIKMHIEIRISLISTSSSLKFNLWKSLSIPVIELGNSLFTRNYFRQSFLDLDYKNDEQNFNELAAMIAYSILKMLQSNRMEKNQTTTYYNFNAEDISNCLNNLSCTFFKDIIGPEERRMYRVRNNAFSAQSFIDEIVNARQIKYLNRLSFFVFRILVILLSQSKYSTKNCTDFKNLVYFESLLNDDEYCFKTKIQLESHFPTDELLKTQKTLSNRSFSLWKRTTVYKHQSVVLFVSFDYSTYSTLIVIYTIVTVLSLAISIFIYRSNVFIEHDNEREQYSFY